MKKQSAAEWLAERLDYLDGRYGFEHIRNHMLAQMILRSLKRRGWRAPEQQTKKGREE